MEELKPWREAAQLLWEAARRVLRSGRPLPRRTAANSAAHAHGRPLQTAARRAGTCVFMAAGPPGRVLSLPDGLSPGSGGSDPR